MSLQEELIHTIEACPPVDTADALAHGTLFRLTHDERVRQLIETVFAAETCTELNDPLSDIRVRGAENSAVVSGEWNSVVFHSVQRAIQGYYRDTHRYQAWASFRLRPWNTASALRRVGLSLLLRQADIAPATERYRDESGRGGLRLHLGIFPLEVAPDEELFRVH